jgi:hypothetical protein
MSTTTGRWLTRQLLERAHWELERADEKAARRGDPRVDGRRNAGRGARTRHHRSLKTAVGRSKAPGYFGDVNAYPDTASFAGALA